MGFGGSIDIVSMEGAFLIPFGVDSNSARAVSRLEG